MNERIRELYSKVVAESENMRWNIEDAEKFAKLIVRECMTVCEDVTERNDPAIACYYAIKEHFGVES